MTLISPYACQDLDTPEILERESPYISLNMGERAVMRREKARIQKRVGKLFLTAERLYLYMGQSQSAKESPINITGGEEVIIRSTDITTTLECGLSMERRVAIQPLRSRTAMIVRDTYEGIEGSIAGKNLVKSYCLAPGSEEALWVSYEGSLFSDPDESELGKLTDSEAEAFATVWLHLRLATLANTQECAVLLDQTHQALTKAR